MNNNNEPGLFDPEGAITRLPNDKIRMVVKLNNINLLALNSREVDVKFIVQSGQAIESGDVLVVLGFELIVTAVEYTFDWGRFGWLVTVAQEIPTELLDKMTYRVGAKPNE